MSSIETVLRGAGLDIQQRTKILNELNAKADDKSDAFYAAAAGRLRTSVIHDGLKNVAGLDAETRRNVTAHLAKAHPEHVFDDGLQSCNASVAVTEANAQAHRRIQNEAARLGFKYVPGEKVDPFELDAALRARDSAPSSQVIERRIALKSNLMRIGALSARN